MRLGLGTTISKKAIKRKPRSLFSNNKSLNFDGTNDYLYCGNDSSAQITGAISISLWMKSSDTSAIQYLVAKDDNTNRNFWLATEKTTGKAWFTFYNSGSGKQVKSTGHNVCDGNWNHIVAIFNTSTEKSAIYVNGELSAESTDHNVTTIDNDTVNLELGRRGNSVYYFNGNMDEVAIWNTALDADAITSIYNSGTPISLSSDSGDYDNSSNLQGYWRMGDGTLDEYPLIADQTNATLGSNLVAEDDFSLGAGWSDTGTNSWSFTSGSYTNLLAQNISGVTIGKIYKAEWTIGSNPNGVQLKWVGVNMFNAGTILDTSVGTHTHYGIATTDDFGFRWQGTSGTLTISDIKLQEVQGNAGLMTNMVSGDIEEDTP